MALRDDINAVTPRLRRFARALVGGSPLPSAQADEIVHATLIRALGARQIGTSGDLAIRLFATVAQLHREAAMAGAQARTASNGRPALVANRFDMSPVKPELAHPTRLSAALLRLSVEEREALLLVSLEGFDHAETARILRISRATLMTRLTQARSTLETHLQARPTASARNIPHLRLVT